jgi:uncharacterized membrane protein
MIVFFFFFKVIVTFILCVFVLLISSQMGNYHCKLLLLLLIDSNRIIISLCTLEIIEKIYILLIKVVAILIGKPLCVEMKKYTFCSFLFSFYLMPTFFFFF